MGVPPLVLCANLRDIHFSVILFVFQNFFTGCNLAYNNNLDSLFIIHNLFLTRENIVKSCLKSPS